MTNKNLTGIVVRAMDYLENDRLLTVLTIEEGTTTIKAKGARRKGAKLSFATGIFFCGNFEIVESKGRYVLTGASRLYDYSGLAENIDKYYLACHFIDIASFIIMEKHPDEEMLRFLLNSLHVMAKDKCKLALLQGIFEFRTAVISGFAPALYECAVCGKDTDSTVFSLISGGFVCCVPGIEADSYVRKAIEVISEAELKDLFSMEIPLESANKLKTLSSSYIEMIFDRKFKTMEQHSDITFERPAFSTPKRRHSSSFIVGS